MINRQIKLAASAASPMTEMQGITGPLWSACQAIVCGLPCILVLEEAALAADLTTRLSFKHPEQSFAAQAASNIPFEYLASPNLLYQTACFV